MTWGKDADHSDWSVRALTRDQNETRGGCHETNTYHTATYAGDEPSHSWHGCIRQRNR